MEALRTRGQGRAARRQQKRRTVDNSSLDDETDADDWERLSLPYNFGMLDLNV